MRFQRKDKSERQSMSRGEASRLGRWLLLALVIHVVIFGVTSVGFIRDTWIDPEGAKERAKLQAAKTAAHAPPAPVTAAPTPAAATPASDGTAAAPGDAPKPEARVLKDINEAAKPEDIPTQPDDLGISLDETNPN